MRATCLRTPVRISSFSFQRYIPRTAVGFREKWFFQENCTGIKIHVEIPENVPAHKSSAWLNANLYKLLRAKHLRRNAPLTAGRVKIMGIDDIGKLKYGWEDEVILVTPRSLRAQPRTGSSSVTYWRYRETTPDRAFRKMKDKVRRSVR